ncbi:MAG: hypothetical protein U1E11_00785 [Dethiobacteria bacterium]|nr:hypothetical protein [Dethiobacteria bacterium]
MFGFARGLPTRLGFSALLLIALIFICGCSADESIEPAVPQETLEEAPYYLDLPTLNPANLFTLTTNPIEFETDPVSLPGDLWSEVSYIRGLTDKEVEGLINKTLDETYEKIIHSGLPPYRGIYRAIPDGAPLLTQSIYAYATFNFNNLISVYVSSDLSYELPALEEENYETENYDYYPPLIYIGQAECLNFDLRSGRQILLPELFADPTTAMALINDAVAKKIAVKHAGDDPGLDMISFDTPLLTGPFKGLPDTQKFNLTSGGINIVIDYLNPEFDCNFYPTQIFLPFSLFDKNLAIEERFMADKNSLYMDTESMEIQFILRDEPDPAQMIWFEEAGISGVVNTYQYYFYPKTLPQTIELRISELRRETEASLESLKDFKPESMNEDSFFDVSINVNRLGPYYTLRYNIYNQSIDIAESMLIMECYAADGRLLELEDCFKPDFNYREALYSAYLEQFSWLGGSALSLEEMFSDLTFALGPTDLEFTVPDAGNYYLYFVPYRDLRFDNLTIFDFN